MSPRAAAMTCCLCPFRGPFRLSQGQAVGSHRPRCISVVPAQRTNSTGRPRPQAESPMCLRPSLEAGGANLPPPNPHGADWGPSFVEGQCCAPGSPQPPSLGTLGVGSWPFPPPGSVPGHLACAPHSPGHSAGGGCAGGRARGGAGAAVLAEGPARTGECPVPELGLSPRAWPTPAVTAGASAFCSPLPPFWEASPCGHAAVPLGVTAPCWGLHRWPPASRRRQRRLSGRRRRWGWRSTGLSKCGRCWSTSTR